MFVRHAPTSWSGRRFCGRADPALTRAGQLIAGRLGAELSEVLAPDVRSVVRIVSSPSRRARQTARAIARVLPGRVAVRIDERWSEADVGIAEGRTFDALAELDPDLAGRLARGEVAIDWPAGESAWSLSERVGAALDDLADEALPTIVVSHAGPLRIAIALAGAAPVERVAFPEPGGWVRLPGIARRRGRR